MKKPLTKSTTWFSLALAKTTTATALAAPPSFSLAWSEYPSWSFFGVAHEQKLIGSNVP